MFFRSKKTKTGQAIQLVESYRDNEGKPRQRVVLSLGGTNLPKELWHAVADIVEAHFQGVLLMFPPPQEVQDWATKIIREMEKKGWGQKREPPQKTISIETHQITHHGTTQLGTELIALKAWETLGFPKLLTQIQLSKKQQIDACLSILNRLIDPCSEHALKEWVKTTSFEDLFSHPLRHLSKDRFYRIADLLLKHKETIEKALNEKEQQLFHLKRSIFLYDLTNTYFEGQSINNTKAKRGRSKEKRYDAPLVSVGLVLDEEGFVLRHEVFSGNTHDSQTLLNMVEKLQNQGEQPLIILDSGFASEKNLAGLKAKGFDYIIVGRRQTRLAYQEEFQNTPFQDIVGREGKSPVQVAMIDKKDERIILCKSQARGKKEAGMISQAEQRYLQDLNKLKKRITKGQLKNPEIIQKNLGKLIGKHPRVARYYKVRLNNSNELIWERLDVKYNSDCQLLGSYYLRSSRKDLDDQTIWKLYITLTRVESGFRALKSDLGLRPIFHQREDRCESHIFITILAYRLLHWIEYTLRSHNIMKSWTTIKRLLQTHCYTTIVCPSLQGKMYHIRTAGIPDHEQSHLYTLFGIDCSKLPRKQTIF